MDYERILEIRYLNKVFTSANESFAAVDDICFDLISGEFLGIMGTSGSGKTTLLNLIGSIIRPTDGEIIFQGKDLNKFNRREIENYRGNLVTSIFQDYRLIDKLTAYENIIIPFIIHKKEVDKNEIESLARILAIDKDLYKYPKDLSGGQKQRIAALRAIAVHPKIILADEPTGALDSKNSELLLSLLKEYNKKSKTSIIMASHDSYAASFCHRILFLKDGKIYNELSIEENENQNDFQKRIIEASRQIIR